MDKYLSKNEVLRYWNELVQTETDLFIYTITTKDLSNDWTFSYRNKILRLLTPAPIKIGFLNFEKEYCQKESQLSKKEKNFLTVHSVMIRDLVKNLNSKSFCLILDIDAFPLSEYAVKLTFVLAFLKGINGNIQRTNCIDNQNHLFIGPSYLCFSSEKIKKLGDLVWITNKRSDVSEEITWKLPDLVDLSLFRPSKTIFKPVWALEGEKAVYGIGTTFSYNKIPINYHHFYSRNFIARVHFFIISFFIYIRLLWVGRKNINIKRRFNLVSIIKEIKFTFKYFIGREM